MRTVMHGNCELNVASLGPRSRGSCIVLFRCRSWSHIKHYATHRYIMYFVCILNLMLEAMSASTTGTNGAGDEGRVERTDAVPVLYLRPYSLHLLT